MLSVTKCMVVGAMAVFFTTAAAQQAGAPQRGACKQDVDKLCKDVQPGEGRIIECLKTHQSDVSPQCASNLKQIKQALKKLSDACAPDVERFCFDTPIGKGGIAGCLKKHSSELSPDCKSAVSKTKSKAKSTKG